MKMPPNMSYGTIQVLSCAAGLAAASEVRNVAVSHLITALAWSADVTRHDSGGHAACIGSRDRAIINEIIPAMIFGNWPDTEISPNSGMHVPIPAFDAGLDPVVGGILESAIQLCEKAELDTVEPAHILCAIVMNGDPEVSVALSDMGINVEAAKAICEHHLRRIND
jgi:hypothetical protein